MATDPNTGFTYAPGQEPIGTVGEDEDMEGQLVSDEPMPPSKAPPYDSIDIALDGWTYRLWREWLGKDDADQRKNSDLFLDILTQYDPSATALLEVSKSHESSEDPYSWVFRFGLYGDPGKVTEAVEKIDGSLLKIAQNWKVIPGSAKAIVTRIDEGGDELIELPRDMIAADLSTTVYRLLDLVQTGGVKAEPTTESSVSELRQISSPDSAEYCSRHQKTGEEHSQEEVDEDIWNTKGEERDIESQIAKLEEELQAWTPGYQAVPKALKSAPIEEPMIEEPPVDFGHIKEEANTYAEEMSKLIETLIKLTEDPTATPEAVEKSSKVAKDRVKDIVGWAEKTVKKIEDDEGMDAEVDEVMDSLQKILEHGSRIQMLLIGTEEGAKQTAETPLAEPVEPTLEPLEGAEEPVL